MKDINHTMVVAKSPSAGFTLVEVVIGLAIVSIVFVGLFLGFSVGFTTMRLSREDSRATQILLEKMETIRLYSWSQINSNGFIPSTFYVPFDHLSTTNSGFIYTGTLAVVAAPMACSYSGDLRMLTVTLDWQSGDMVRHREMSTLVSQYGIQNYIY